MAKIVRVIVTEVGETGCLTGKDECFAYTQLDTCAFCTKFETELFNPNGVLLRCPSCIKEFGR